MPAQSAPRRSLLSRLFGRKPPAPAQARSFAAGTFTDLLEARRSGGGAVTQQTALGLPAVASCVRLIGEMVARLPVGLYRKSSQGPVGCPAHPAHQVVNYPGELHHGFGFRRLLMVGALLGGNGYARVHRSALGEPAELEWLSPQRVQVERLKGQRYLTYRIEGESGLFTARDILHLRALSTDGVRGHSPIALLRESIGTSLSLRTRASGLLDRSAQFNGVVKLPPEATPEQVQQMREFWTRRHQGPGTEGIVPILQGAEFQSIGGMSAVDAEFLKNRVFELQEIARLYGVPAFLIGDPAATTWGSGIEQLNLGFIHYCLDPWLINFEHSLNATLLTRAEAAGGYFFSFDREELGTQTLPSQSAFIASMRNSGVFSANDAREWLGYPRVPAPEMDYYQTVPVGGGPLDQAGEGFLSQGAVGGDDGSGGGV